uniref:uncharacterized protein LOC127068519 n=1 Tax=Vespula vulgaris TaxID=7454 RepID=UPI00223B0450|nr:uncharacterized protein LOC127068519 [Vespula vulgaris]
MSVENGLIYFEQHFLFSNKFFQYTMGLRPYQCSNDLLFQVCTIIAYVFPTIAHQFYQLAISDVTLESTVKVLQKMLAAVSILWIYTTVYFSFVNVRVIFVVLASLFLIKETFKNVESVLNFQIKEIFSQLKLDYTLMSGKDEFEIMFKYNKGGKMYAYMVTGFFNIYFIATVTPCVLNVFLYHIGTSENVNLTLPIPINNISNPGIIYYTLLIYQIVAMYISVILGSACFSLYLVLVHHACCQLSIIRYAIFSQRFLFYHKYRNMLK